MAQAHETLPHETLPPTTSDATQRRTGWVIAITLAALALLIIVVLYAIDVL